MSHSSQVHKHLTIRGEENKCCTWSNSTSSTCTCTCGEWGREREREWGVREREGEWGRVREENNYLRYLILATESWQSSTQTSYCIRITKQLKYLILSKAIVQSSTCISACRECTAKTEWLFWPSNGHPGCNPQWYSMFVDVCLSSVILNVCPRVFGMLVHM